MKRKWSVWLSALRLITLMQVTTVAQTLVDLEFNGARVQDVLQVLRRLGDFNIVADPQVTGEVTVFLKQVTVREAVGLVAQAAGYSYRFQGNTVHIAPEQRLGALFAPSAQGSRPFQNVDVINLNHADPEGLANVIRTIEPNATVTVDAFTRSLIVYGSDHTIASVRRLIPLLDTIQRQVLVDARLVEVSLESLDRLGLTWDVPSFALSLQRGASLSMTSERLGIILEALKNEGSARVLANPKISAVNASTATFLIGDRIPILMQQTDDLGRVTGFLETIEAGIKLGITPIIGDDGFVTLKLTTGVSGITGMTPQNIPQIRTREVSTTVRVQDGQPLVIGGLIQEEDRVTISGIPILQGFPLVGELFRRKQNQKVQTETVIFLTPHIVSAAPRTASPAPAQRSTTDPQSPQAAISPEARRTTSAGGYPVEPAVAPALEPSNTPASKSTAAASDQRKTTTPEPKLAAGPVPRARTSISLDLVLLAARTVDLELESGAETKFLTRIHVKQGEYGITGGVGLGLRRYLVGPLWADIGGEYVVAPDSQKTAAAASTQFGIRVPIGKRAYLDPYAGYRYPIPTVGAGTLFGRTEGVYWGIRLGW